MFHRFRPGHGSAFCCGQILHGMEGKTGKICNFSAFLSVLLRSERMGCVRHHQNPAHFFLTFTGRVEQRFLLFCNGENLRVIRIHDSGKIHTDHCFRPLRHRCFHLFRIHNIGSRNRVNQYRSGSHMADHAAGRGIGIRRRNDFIPRSDPHRTQGHFHAGRCRSKGSCPFRMAACCNLLF